jgi:hypothetical protein
MLLSRRLKILLFPRLVQAIFAVVVTALVGRMISTSGWNAIPRKGGNAAPVNFSIFLGVWVLFLTPFYIWFATYLSPHQGRGTGDREVWEKRCLVLLRALVALDGVTLILFFSGAIAMSAGLGVHSCKNDSYTTSNGITNSSPNTKVRCREAQAVTAFLWFQFIAFGASLALDIRVAYYKYFPERLAAKVGERPAIQADSIGYGGHGEIADVEMRVTAPTGIYGTNSDYAPPGAGNGVEDGDMEPKDEYVGDSIRGRRKPDVSVAQPVPQLQTKPETPFTVFRKNLSAAMREMKGAPKDVH